MSDFVLIPLEQIRPNPFQPRQREDPEKVNEIAVSIYGNRENGRLGLLQVPTGRRQNKHVELAFGHTRLAAFQLLAMKGIPDAGIEPDKRFQSMPLYLDELTDRQLFELAIAENLKRHDLNPIEQAAALERYMQEFKATSAEAGALFGLSADTVRGKVRLLDLPKPVQEKVGSGEITEGAARKLLTIARVDQKQVEAAAERIATGSPVEDALEIAMRHSDSAFSMWGSWEDGKPKGGKGLWPLDTSPEKFPVLPVLDEVSAAKALGTDLTKKDQATLSYWIGNLSVSPDNADTLISGGAPANIIEYLAHLLHPPACTACPFHAVADNNHYCGFKACHTRKKKAWVTAEMQRVSKRLQIAIYNPAKDGKDVLPLADSTYESNYTYHAKLFRDRDLNLRLQTHHEGYRENKHTESFNVRVILVGKRAQAVKEKKRQERNSRASNEEKQRQQHERERRFGDASRKFKHEYAEKQFGSAFKEITKIPLAALCALIGVKLPKGKKAEILARLRVALASEALRHLKGYDWQLAEKGPVATAKHLQSVAKTWGVQLPADFLTVAKQYEHAVSTETEKGDS